MATMTQGYPLPRVALWFVAGLLVVSAALFVIGVALERSGERHEIPVVHQDTAPAIAGDSDGGENHADSGEGQAAASTTAQVVSAQNESVLGIDLENPWLVGAAVLISLVLVGGLVRFGYRVLPVIVLFAIAFALFDVSEVVRQLQRQNTPITLLATLVLLAHVAVGAAALLSFHKYRAGVSARDPLSHQ